MYVAKLYIQPRFIGTETCGIRKLMKLQAFRPQHNDRILLLCVADTTKNAVE